jgi:hypothetical protein
MGAGRGYIVSEGGGLRMTEEQFLQKLKAIKNAKGLSDLERLLDKHFGEKTQQKRRGR